MDRLLSLLGDTQQVGVWVVKRTHEGLSHDVDGECGWVSTRVEAAVSIVAQVFIVAVGYASLTRRA